MRYRYATSPDIQHLQSRLGHGRQLSDWAVGSLFSCNRHSDPVQVADDVRLPTHGAMVEPPCHVALVAPA